MLTRTSQNCSNDRFYCFPFSTVLLEKQPLAVSLFGYKSSHDKIPFEQFPYRIKLADRQVTTKRRGFNKTLKPNVYCGANGSYSSRDLSAIT